MACGFISKVNNIQQMLLIYVKFKILYNSSEETAVQKSYYSSNIVLFPLPRTPQSLFTRSSLKTHLKPSPTPRANVLHLFQCYPNVFSHHFYHTTGRIQVCGLLTLVSFLPNKIFLLNNVTLLMPINNPVFYSEEEKHFMDGLCYFPISRVKLYTKRTLIFP